MAVSLLCWPAVWSAPSVLDSAVRFAPGEGSTRFIAQGSRYRLALDPRGAQLEIRGEKGGSTRIDTRFVGAHLAQLEATDPLAAHANFIRGSDPARWRNRVPLFSRVRYKALYPGIDLVFYGTGPRLEYDFVVAPGADPSRIRMRFRGVDRLRLANGDLILDTSAGEIRWKRPEFYQQDGNEKIAVEGGFLLRGREVAFHIGAYEKHRRLIIDPALSYSSYLGGSGSDGVRAIGIDGAGNIYIAGGTSSPNLRTSGSSYQFRYGGASQNNLGDAFVAKITAAGSLAYLTYLGGSDDDSALAIAVDSGGNAYVTGMTISSNFPVTQGAYQKSFKGRGGNDYGRGGDAFAAKFNPSGGLVYSTYLGGSRDDGASAIAIDGSGNAYIAGATLSTDFPTTPGAYQTSLKGFGGQPDIFVGGPDNVIRTGDVFVAKLNSSGSALVFSTLLGGSKDEAPSSIALDGAGNVYVGGGTLSSDFPTTANAYQRTFKGATAKSTQSFFLLGDGFISKLDPSGSSLLYSTLLGGSSGDAVMSIALDSAGGLYAAGMTSSDDFPASANAYQRSYRGPALAQMQTFIDGDGFVAKFDSSGRLAYSTYLGGESDDSVWAVAPDPSGNAIVAGGTNSRTFPVTSDALQKTFGGGGGHFYMQTGDAFIAKLDTAGATLLYSCYLGGSRDDGAGGMVLDSQGNAYLAGFSISNDFPVTAGAAQPSPGGSGNDDAMVAKISGLFSPPALTLNGISNAASYNASAVSPGEIVFVSAPASGPQNIVTAQVDTATNSLKTSLAGVQLLFDGVPAPLVYVARDQLSGIVPYRVASQQTSKVQMQANGVVSNAITVNVAPAVPGIFSADSTGKGPGAILNQDGSYNSPSNPAAPNDIIVFFGTGEGQTVPPGQDGLLATTVFPKPQLPVTVSIGGLPAEVVYAGAAPLYTAGLLQINARVPAGVASGSQPVVLHIGTADSQAGLTISIK